MRIARSPVYLDTSALAKIYVAEATSQEIEESLAGRRDLLVSDLAVTELSALLMRRVREGFLTVEGAMTIYRVVSKDLAMQELHRIVLDESIHREAERLLMELGARVALRAADALHLALAARTGTGTLVTYDRRMAAAAREMGRFELPVG